MMHIIYAHIWCLSFSTSCASPSQLLLIPEAVKRASFGIDNNGYDTTSWLSALGISCCSKHPRPWPCHWCLLKAAPRLALPVMVVVLLLKASLKSLAMTLSATIQFPGLPSPTNKFLFCLGTPTYCCAS